jgi:hypothetical protein
MIVDVFDNSYDLSGRPARRPFNKIVYLKKEKHCG